jgi:DNA modification methylase
VVVVRADAAHLPMPDESADLVLCSPPYFGLRSYTDNGEHYDGQIGSEETPREYIAALLACTREWLRVLKPEGSIFVNLGDKYAGSASGGTQNGACGKRGTDGDRKRGHVRTAKGIMPKTDTPAKSLIGLPWRYALGCVDDLGLILRSEIIWDKPNGLPESVTDRVRRSHEQIFHFTRQPRYYSAVDEVREAHSGNTHARRKDGQPSPKNANGLADGVRRGYFAETTSNPLGKLPGSVWSIPSAPLTAPAHLGVDHFAAYPPELVRRIILGWSPSGICTECGEGRRPVCIKQHFVPDTAADRWATDLHTSTRGKTAARGRRRAERDLTGYACACAQPDAPTRPAVVVDPFGGTGTTALVASVLGRTGITVDRSADYCRLATWRCNDPGERARALGVPKPPPVADGQGSLFDDLDEAS